MDFLHAFFRKDDTRKKWTRTRAYFLCAFLMAFIIGKVNAQFTSAGIDGNPQEWTQANINSIPIHSFIHDAFGNGVVDSQFTEGSKDFFFAADLRWAVSQTKAKNDIANAAALLTDGKLFFAGDRTSNNGDAQIAFWFYLNGTGPHVRADGVQDFAPEHVIGDLLILADFTGGGRNANVTVLKWVETGGNVPNTNGRLNTTNIVGVVAENNDGAVAVPAGWIFTSNTFSTNEFYEGVVDLAGLNLPSLCFSSFLLETRSSQSITASLDDFASASFNARPQPPTVNGAERCGGGELTLTASCNGSGVHWFTNVQGGSSLGQADGVSADGNSLTRNFNSTQTFFASCFNAQINCESERVPVTGTVNPPATSNAGVDQTVCASDPQVTLAGIVGGSATSGTWSGGTGTFNSNANTLNAVYTPSAAEIAAGSVELTLTTNDPAGPCPPVTDKNKVRIVVTNDATVNAGPDQKVCASNPSVTLAGIVGGGATSGTWSGGTGTFNPNANTLNAVYTPSAAEIAAGFVDLVLTTNDPEGPCNAAHDVMRITIHPNPVISLSDLTLPACTESTAKVLLTITSGSAPFDIFFDGSQILANISSFPQQLIVPADGNNHIIKVTDAKRCTDEETVNGGTPPECAPLPGHCTYTQGQYGTFNGQACLPDGSSVLAQDIMTKALDAEPNDFRDFGVVANNKFFRLTLSDVSGGSGANIYKMLPGGGNACALKGFATFTQTNTWSNVPLSTKPQTLGKILNTLLAQTITLYFNLSEDPTLSSEPVQDTIITSKQTFCGSGIAQPATEDTFGFPHSVVVFLNNNNDAFDYPNTVEGLFKLANDVLGGVSVPVNCTDVATAVDVFNNAFDGCRIQTGSIPFNEGSSLIVNNSLHTSDIISGQPTIETVNEVQIKAYPNPFSNKVNFRFVSPVKSKATLEIYNISGQRIALLFRVVW